jgi:hypothetical protein
MGVETAKSTEDSQCRLKPHQSGDKASDCDARCSRQASKTKSTNNRRPKQLIFVHKKKGPKYKLKGLADNLLGGHLGSDDIHGLIEVLDKPVMVDRPSPSGKPTR